MYRRPGSRPMPLLYSVLAALIGMTSMIRGSSYADSAYLEMSNPLTGHIRRRVQSPLMGNLFDDSRSRAVLVDQTAAFYKGRDFAPAWVDARRRPSQRIDSLLNVLWDAADEGLDPMKYHVTWISLLRDTINASVIPDSGALARLDLLATAAYMLYAMHVSIGRIDPTLINSRWKSGPGCTLELGHSLHHALRDNSIRRSLMELAPRDKQYRRLREYLRRYHAIARQGGWPRIPAHARVRLGDSGSVAVALRQRLALSGDIDSSAGMETVAFDSSMIPAILRFQERHGLHVDGIIGPQTLKALNVSVEERIAQIAVNMERIRWCAHEATGRHILVNIPEYVLRLYDDERSVLSMRVIVGKSYHSTPILTDTMNHIVLNPDWTMPARIAREQIFPLLQADLPFPEGQYEIYDGWTRFARIIDRWSIDWNAMEPEQFDGYKVVQLPGPDNPLGRIKFVLPNRMNIYLHDTPADHLFHKTSREFSNGCIRLEYPVDLAEYLLRDSGWDRYRILDSIGGTTPIPVSLPHPFAVHFIYRTAFIDDLNRLHFRQDIYGHDHAQSRYLALETQRLLERKVHVE